MNSSTVWMWLGIVVLGVVAIVRVQAALAPEEARTSRPEPTEMGEAADVDLETVLTGRSYERGDCVTWEQRGGWRDTEVVPCEEDHLLEVVGRIDHPGRADDPHPNDEQWEHFYEEVCDPLVAVYLDGGWDPFGTLGSGGIRPTEASWQQGDRTVWCGVVAASEAAGDEFLPLRGRAADLDQSLVYATGTCFEAGEVMVPVPCDVPHHFLVLGELDLSATEARPSDTDLQTRCGEAMGRAQGEGGQFVTFLGFDPESWNAGSRRGTCVLGAFDSAGAPVLQEPGALHP